MALMDYTLRPVSSQLLPAADGRKPTWTASFAEEREQQAHPPSIEAIGHAAEYSCGNNNSEAFFKKMEGSLAEANRLRAQCRAAAAVSAARNPEEKVKLDHFTKSVDVAAGVGAYSGTFNFERLGDPLAVPAHLGHLLVPQPTIPAHPPQEVLLPGAIADPEVDTASSPSGGVQVRLVSAATGGGLSEPAGLMPLQRGLEEFEAAPPLPVHSDLHTSLGVGSLGAGLFQPLSSQDSTSNFGESEPFSPERLQPPAEAIEEDRRSSASAGSKAKSAPSQKSRSATDEDSDETDSDEMSDGWPPKPPLLRFKMRMQFSSRFKPTEHLQLFEKSNADLKHKMTDTAAKELKDPDVGWLNTVFHMSIATEFQFEVTFPILILTILDAIYTRRVKWREVDFRYQYRRSLMANYSVAERIWGEVNMEKAKEFRFECTQLRLENMAEAPIKDKLAFMRLLRRWYEHRCYTADPYEPLARRREIVAQCLAWGHSVQFPPWIRHDKEEPEQKIERVIKDTWRVLSKAPIAVLSAKNANSEVIAEKKYGETFRGHMDGDWVMLVDEPGWIVRVVAETREKIVEKQETFRVVTRQVTCSRTAPRHEAAPVAKKKFGDIVNGYVYGDWVELAGEEGYMDIFAPGTRARVLETCTVEDYHKMPEYKRLIWFLGSPDYQHM